MSVQAEASIATDLAVCIRDVGKSYKHFKLSNVSLQIERGTVAGLIGPNGAGKTTTMRILMGLIRPDSGSVSVLGQPISSAESVAKQEIGYFSDDMRLYKPESLSWHMQFVKSLYPSSWDDQYAKELLKRFGLIEQQAFRGLSHGQRVKSMLLLILARRPKFMILDEPTNGLDPVAKHEIIAELMRVMEDPQRTILYSSHNTQDVEQISDSITFIDRGRVIESSDRDRFVENWKRIKLHAPENWNAPQIDGLRLESSFRSLRIFTHNHFQEEMLPKLVVDGAAIESIEPMTLEEIFVSTVMRGREENPS